MSSLLYLLHAAGPDRARMLVRAMAKALPKSTEPFGARLRRLRAARGLTQEELGAKIGLSKRMIAYYEIQGGTPSPDQLAHFAKTLSVSIDELLDTKSRSAALPADDAPHGPAELRLWRRLRQIQKLPAPQRRAVLKVLDGLIDHQTKDRNDDA